jgi:hypothetical protein
MSWIKKIKQKELPSLLFKTMVFFFIVFILDFVAGSILANLYSKQKPGEIYRISYSMDSTKADILIFGASRANHHYVPDNFKKRMNLTCYNTGRDGQIILYNYAILKSVLKRYSPKIAVLDFSRDEFEVEQQSYDRLSALIPYYKSHPEVRKIIDLRSPYEKYKMVSCIYPYNSLIFSLIMGAIDSHKERKNIQEQNGYIPLTESCYRGLAEDTSYGAQNLDSTKIKYFKSFIKDCKNAHVQLFVVFSPVFVTYRYEDPSITLAKSICKENDIPVFDFINDSSFYNSNFFAADGTHLNDTGAKTFTDDVIDSMMKDQSVNISKKILVNKQNISDNLIDKR